MSKTYIGQIIEQVNAVTERCGTVLLYGENIDTGSRIAGLARGLKVNPEGRILNVGNCELTHVGLGLGMMLDQGQAVLFMKQLDFLLLGVDQMANTFALVRAFHEPRQLGSFTIFPIVCDQGYQGPQSSLNNASDIASLANVPVYCLNAAEDATHVVRDQFVASGFRVVCTSQRLFGAPALELPLEWRASDNSIFKYRSGDALTIACYNFALRDAAAMTERLAAVGVQSELFHVNYVPGLDVQPLLDSCARTRALVIVDDSKTVTKFGDALVTEIHAREMETAVLSLVRRGCTPTGYGVAEDRFIPDYDAVLAFAQRN